MTSGPPNTKRGEAPSGEERIIESAFAPLVQGWPGAYDLLDDCATIEPAPGQELVVKTDPVRAGVHFFPDDKPDDIAWKALAVNVSDLAAKGARPLAYLLAISFPEKPAAEWLAGFAGGLSAAQDAFGMNLVGGDTDRADGPMTIAVTVMGEVPVGRMVRRGAARAGDLLFVSGALGEAALGLLVRSGDAAVRTWGLDDAAMDTLRERYLRPQPRLGLKAALRNYASAAMDLSDGLAKDLGRMCRASGTGAEIEIDKVPRSDAMRKALAADQTLVQALVAAGDDYEILAAVPPENADHFVASAAAGGVNVCHIGHVTPGPDVRFATATGDSIAIERSGYDHF